MACNFSLALGNGCLPGDALTRQTSLACTSHSFDGLCLGAPGFPNTEDSTEVVNPPQFEGTPSERSKSAFKWEVETLGPRTVHVAYRVMALDNLDAIAGAPIIELR